MDLSKPLMLGLGALLVGKLLSRGSAPAGSSAGSASSNGGLAGGLGGLLDKLQNAGHGETVKSWLGPGQNQPIQPGQLRSALGDNTVGAAAQQAGMSEQDLLSQLAQALPQFVDKLTPSGRIPSLREVAAALSQK